MFTSSEPVASYASVKQSASTKSAGSDERLRCIAANTAALITAALPEDPELPAVWPAYAVLLPHARARMLLDDTPRMAVFAQRFGPGRCVLLEGGTRIELDRDRGSGWPPGTRVLAGDGHETAREAA